MIDNIVIENIIRERKNLHPDDPRVAKKWNELTQIFVKNEDDTIAYLDSCREENVNWIGEVFDDISAHLKSSRFIECIDRLSVKYSNLDLEQDIFYAKKYCESNKDIKN